MHHYTAATVPGCRLPHLWLENGRSLYDELGPEFTLLRFDASVSAEPLLAAARSSGVPMKLLDVHFDSPPAPYRHALHLCRPDIHIAWRGNASPSDPEKVIAAITGRSPAQYFQS